MEAPLCKKSGGAAEALALAASASLRAPKVRNANDDEPAVDDKPVDDDKPKVDDCSFEFEPYVQCSDSEDECWLTAAVVHGNGSAWVGLDQSGADSGSTWVAFQLLGVEPGCVQPPSAVEDACSVQIYEAQSCSAQLGGKLTTVTNATDPYSKHLYVPVKFDAMGNIQYQISPSATAGRVIVVHNLAGEPAACAEIPATCFGGITETTSETPSTDFTSGTTSETPSTEFASETTSATPSTDFTSETTSATPSTDFTSETTSATPSTDFTSETTSATPSTDFTSETTSATPTEPGGDGRRRSIRPSDSDGRRRSSSDSDGRRRSSSDSDGRRRSSGNSDGRRRMLSHPKEPTTEPEEPILSPFGPKPSDEECRSCDTWCSPCQACADWQEGECYKCWHCWDYDDDEEMDEDDDDECNAVSKDHDWDDEEVKCLSATGPDCRLCWGNQGPAPSLFMV